MALSTRAKLAGLGGALALGVLGAAGVAYAAGDGTGTGTGTARYVTTIDDGTTQYGRSAPGDQPRGGREDCPEKGGSGGSGGSGQGGGGTGSPAPQESAPAPVNPADA